MRAWLFVAPAVCAAACAGGPPPAPPACPEPAPAAVASAPPSALPPVPWLVAEREGRRLRERDDLRLDVLYRLMERLPRDVLRRTRARVAATPRPTFHALRGGDGTLDGLVLEEGGLAIVRRETGGPLAPPRLEAAPVGAVPTELPEGTPGLPFDRVAGSATKVLFVTLDGGRWELDEHDLVPLEQGTVPATPPLVAFLDHDDVQSLVVVDELASGPLRELRLASRAFGECWRAASQPPSLPGGGAGSISVLASSPDAQCRLHATTFHRTLVGIMTTRQAARLAMRDRLERTLFPEARRERAARQCRGARVDLTAALASHACAATPNEGESLERLRASALTLTRPRSIAPGESVVLEGVLTNGSDDTLVLTFPVPGEPPSVLGAPMAPVATPGASLHVTDRAGKLVSSSGAGESSAHRVVMIERGGVGLVRVPFVARTDAGPLAPGTYHASVGLRVLSSRGAHRFIGTVDVDVRRQAPSTR